MERIVNLDPFMESMLNVQCPTDAMLFEERYTHAFGMPLGEEIVRCKDCKHYEPEYTWEEFREVGHPYETCVEPPTCTLGYALSGVARDTIPNGFCACGEYKG